MIGTSINNDQAEGTRCHKMDYSAFLGGLAACTWLSPLSPRKESFWSRLQLQWDRNEV